ncbi:MAG TPA: hypothetical protein VH518_23870, partial [Tepidisphaeraceae bacterium]
LLRAGIAQRHPIWATEGIAWGWASAAAHLFDRKPVRPEAYRLSRLLASARCMPLSDIEGKLPAKAHSAQELRTGS